MILAKKNKPSSTPAAVERRLMPAVSVIIPMYNAEKYVGECLDSLLAQTFQDFEVIVVDDCSTDSSYSIVESYREKFGGRLKLSKTKANSSGGGYVPRNIGLGLSRGDYIFFVDADDFIAENALETFLTAAKNFDADVIYTGNHYKYIKDQNTELERDKEGKILLQNGLEDKPTLTVDDPNKNFQRLLLGGDWFHTPWSKFVRREILIENEIIFPKIFSGGDFIWTIQVLYYAKKLLRISKPIYYYREASASITRKKDSSNEQIAKCVSAFLMGTKALHELSDKIHLLKNQVYFRAAINPFFNNSLRRTFQERMSLNAQEIYEILYREFAKGNSSFDLTVPFFFSVIDSQQKSLIQAQQRFVKFNQFTVQARQRIAELEAEVSRLKSKE